MVNLEEIQEFYFDHIPFDTSFPIKSARFVVRARNRKEAELIHLENYYKWGDIDKHITVTEGPKGYRNGQSNL